FMDVKFPEHVGELIAKKLVEWREVFQQRKIATAVERITEKTTTMGASIAEELAKLKELLDKGVITREEFEKAKKKLLGE
ncbi:MAG: SHOCT domain-containing protein, partial [Candidatus Nezhaarchaeales archaeon]